MSHRVQVAVVLCMIAGASTVAAQPAAPPGDPSSFAEPMPLYREALGPFERHITSASPEAQAYFTQGLQMLFAFAPEGAARSFREAQKRDPACAMCFWGEAMAWGPYLNGGMGRDDAPRASAAIRSAQRLAMNATEVERALIDALSARYVPTHEVEERARLDTAYANAMAQVWQRFPHDLEVGTLYAEALMLLEPRRGTWDIEKPAVQRIHEVLEAVLDEDITHPGACHLYVHATESTTEPGKAEACAEHLGDAIPGASHINHMPSHTYVRVGRWGDAVRANIHAWHSDQRAAIEEAFAIYPSHNLHMLLFAASYDGQGALAIQAAKDYAGIVRGGQFYHALALLRFGRFDEILELVSPPDNAVHRGLWDFARGYAHLRASHVDSARAYLDRVERAAGESAERSFRGHSAADLLGITGGILRAELLRADGDLEAAIAAAQEAVRLEDGLTYDEPEPLNFAARHWLGALLLEAGRADEAERVYLTELEDHPDNGWSLFGLEQACSALGRAAEADVARVRFERAWARADVWLKASRY